MLREAVKSVKLGLGMYSMGISAPRFAFSVLSGVARLLANPNRGEEDAKEAREKTKPVNHGIYDCISGRFCQFHRADWDAKSKTIVLENK